MTAIYSDTAPNNVSAYSNMTGAITDIDEDPDSPDGLWMSGIAAACSVRVGFSTPSIAPYAQDTMFRLWMKKTGVGAGTGDAYPDGTVFTLSNLSGAYTNVDEDPDSPDANWLTAPGNNVTTSVRASFPTPSGPPSGTQTFRAWVRKTNHTTNPTAVVELWETGGSSALATVVTSTTISSTTGQMLSGTWNASLLGTADGSAVEIRVVGSPGGGSPSNRASVEVGALEWQYATSAFTVNVRVEAWENGASLNQYQDFGITSTTGQLIEMKWNSTTLNAADGSNVECQVYQLDASPPVYMELGAIEFRSARAPLGYIGFGNSVDGVLTVWTSGRYALAANAFVETYGNDQLCDFHMDWNGAFVPTETQNMRVRMWIDGMGTNASHRHALTYLDAAVLVAPNAPAPKTSLAHAPFDRLKPRLVR